MNNGLSATWLIQSIKLARVGGLVLGSILLVPGCKIPGLRCAQPGSEMPQAYNWNNGNGFWSGSGTPERLDTANPGAAAAAQGVDSGTNAATGKENQSEDQDSSPNDDSARLDAPSDRKGPNGFVKFASFLKLNKSAPAEDKSEPSAESDKLVAGEINNTSLYPVEDFANLSSGPGALGAEPITLENSAQLPQNAFYTDANLLGLINQALAGNQELKILGEEIQIARNETYARSGEYRPFVTLGTRLGVEKSGRHTRAGAVEDQLEVAPGRDFPDPLPDFLVATNVSWELDIWKKLRNAQRAAAMRYLGTQEGRNYTVTRLVAEVAEKYYELLALDNRLITLDKTIQLQQQSLFVAEAKKAAGQGTELAVQRFQAEVQKNLSERAIIDQEIVQVENRLNFLAGRYPQRVERFADTFIDLNLNTLNAGVPSQLLQNRADIRQAERNVAAAGLDVQVARARFYPSLTLTGGLGWNAFSSGYLFQTPESLIYGMAGELVGPLINKRAIKADYCSANAAQLQSIYSYQQTVLEAHIEVVNQISKVENFRRSIEVKKQQLASLEASVDAANKLFQGGLAEYVEVLLAQREMMEARMVLIDTKRQQLSAIVNAYQALGGGF